MGGGGIELESEAELRLKVQQRRARQTFSGTQYSVEVRGHCIDVASHGLQSWECEKNFQEQLRRTRIIGMIRVFRITTHELGRDPLTNVH